MKANIWVKSMVYPLLFSIILSSVATSNLGDEEPWWNNEWSFRQEITIPLDTADSKHQPVDIRIGFKNRCWAENEDVHSIRVVFQHEGNFEVLESQIYNLEYIDDKFIGACNLVFIIPEEANGREKYFIYYDNSAKQPPAYEDRVDVEESYFVYEPIPGYLFESHYYKITEEGYIIYSVSLEGEFLGYTISQHVTKFEEKTLEVVPKNGESVASFDFKYYYGQGMTDYSSTSQRLLSHEIRVDGNLMVEFSIVSTSNREDIRTTAVYKYYYTPSSDKRLRVHVKHETLRGCRVSPGLHTDGIYAGLKCGGVKSTSIKELNFGEILPYLHLYNEKDMVNEYLIDLDPEYIPDDPDIRILNTEDDVDLGEKAWVSFDAGEKGIWHSLILGSTSVVKAGRDERDGVQVKAYEMDYPHLPGLESNTAFLQLGRNSYEKGDVHDVDIPEDFIAEFDIEFFTTQQGGLKALQEEVDAFQSLVEILPSNEKEDGMYENEKGDKRHTLDVYVHFAPSFPMGSSLSVLTGRSFPYVTVELYRNNELVGKGTAKRLPLSRLSDFNESEGKKDKQAIRFDWRNLSFFKKIRFRNLEPGRYVVKIYKENLLSGEERRYIGFKTVDVKKDTKTNVFCKPEGSMHVLVVDQNDEKVKNAKVSLLKDNAMVIRNITDEKGMVSLEGPLDSYVLRVIYNGFILFEETIDLKLLGKITSEVREVNIERHVLKLRVLDTWGLPPGVELNPFLSSEEMTEPTTISPETYSVNNYVFTNLTPATYLLNLRYKLFSVEKQILVPAEEDISVVFPAEFRVKINTLDSRGTLITNSRVTISRGGVEIKEDGGRSSVLLPPGSYQVKVYNGNRLIGARRINVLGERIYDLITTQEPLHPFIVTVFAVALAITGLTLTFVKKKTLYFLTILPISLALESIVLPWWMLHGSTSEVETSTQMFLTPLKMVTMTSTSEVIAGGLAFLPETFLDIMNLIPCLIGIGCILIFSTLILKTINKKMCLIISAIVVFTCSLLIFYIGMSTFVEVGVGGFTGEGNLDVGIPGEETISTVFCGWGPSSGFYLLLISIIILSLMFLINLREFMRKKSQRM